MNEEPQGINPIRYPGDGLATVSGITPMTVFLAVLKRPWILILMLLMIMVPLIGYIYTIVPVYISSAMVMVSNTSGRSFLEEVAGMGDYFTEERSDRYYTSILDSRAFYDQVTWRFLQLNPDLPGDSVQSMVRGGISYAKNPREEGFLTLSARSQSPDMALRLAQVALEEFRNRAIELEREDAVRVSKFIDEQIGHISDELAVAERELQDFLTSRDIVITDVETGIVGELFDLEKNLSQAEASAEMCRINIESYSQQISDMMKKLSAEYTSTQEEGVDSLKLQMEQVRLQLQQAEAERQSEASIHKLMNEMERLRLQMVNRIAAPSQTSEGGYPTIGVTLQKLEEKLEAALIEQTGFQNQIYYFQAQIDQFKAAHPNLPDDVLEYARLTRSKDVLQTTLEFMLTKRETARIRVALEQGGIQVIDEPRMPAGPVSQSRMKKLVFGILAAIFLGLLVSTVADRLDNTVREESDVRQTLGLSVFGTIPVLTHEKLSLDGMLPKALKRNRGNGAEGRLLTSFDQKSPVAEAYRSLKITIQFAAKDQRKKVFVISSPSASEGKSLTTANLGISFAQGGKRTLIIDGDLRRAIQHRFFDMDRKPGLTNYLYGDNELKDSIHPTNVNGLFLLTAGTSPLNPAELLASHQMKDLVAKVREEFDIVLIDSPPIMICSDPLVMAEAADGIIVIAKVESTKIRAIEHAATIIQRLNIDLAGVILNQIELRFGSTYYFAYRYYRPYSYYGSYTYVYDYEEGAGGEQIKKHRRIATSEKKDNPT